MNFNLQKLFNKINQYVVKLKFKVIAGGRLRIHSGCQICVANGARLLSLGESRLIFGKNSQLIMHENSQLIVSDSFSFGRGCTVILHKDAKLVLGRDSWALHDCWIEVGPGEIIEIGDRVTLQLRCSLHGSVRIDEDTLLAPDVFISSGSHSFGRDSSLTIREQDLRYHVSMPVVIERNSWLGIRTWIAPGLRLAEGTITGANSVITKNTDKHSVYAGVPAVKIRTYK